MAPVSKGTLVPCCVEAAPFFEAKARYALHMLLLPLGLEPEWAARGELRAGIYYGSRPPTAEAVLVAAFSPDAEEYFASRAPYDGQVDWLGDRQTPVLFSDSSGRPDLVASTFFWLSGWQEAVSTERDEHGRYPYEASLQRQYGIAHIPVVDRYREILLEDLQAAGIAGRRRLWNGKPWAFSPTHDVDYLRKWRPGILYRDFVQHPQRIPAVLSQMMEGDPYRRALRRMQREVSARGGTATYFFKAGATDEHDVAYRIDGGFGARTMLSLRKNGFEIGLHPSYRTPDLPAEMRAEKERLERATGSPAASVRQHYLRYDPAKTPHVHASLGFAIDSTLGFAEHEGFRRGTCLPFKIYDLESDRPLEVWEMPLSVMESTLFNRRGLSVEEALRATSVLVDEVRRSGGVLVGLWHNTLWDEIDCPGWGRHFTGMLDLARGEGALIDSLENALQSWT